MFFTKIFKPKNYRVLFKKTMRLTSEFVVFSDVLTTRYKMKLVVIQKENKKYSFYVEESGFPLTPVGIFYNLKYRMLFFKEVIILNFKTKNERCKKAAL